MDFDSLLSELINKSGLKKNDIQSLVDKKYLEMNNLITKEGAIYLIAREFDISLPENSTGRASIKSVAAGMRNINLVGRIFKISKVNEFTKSNGTAGRVSNVFIGDNTGFIRIPLWDEQVKMLEDNIISIGDTVQVNNGFARENTFGETEISLGRFGSIHTIDSHVDLPSVEDLSKMVFSLSLERTTISDVVAGGSFEIKGAVVQIFKGNFLFDVCSMCGNKVENSRCAEHGEMAPGHAMVLSFVLDDGTGDLRCVLFRETAEKMAGVTSDELSKINAEGRYQLLCEKLLGKEMILSGRVKKNTLFDRMEMMVSEFKDINPLEESKKLLDEIELMVGA
jgi:ssDNA-binding replication factor A large subunit